jgi:subtilisin family serine protease
MTTNDVSSALAAIRDSSVDATKHTESLEHLKSLALSSLQAPAAYEVLAVCLAPPAEDVYGTQLSLNQMLKNLASYVVCTDQVLQLDIALAVLPALVDFIVLKRATTEAPHKSGRVTVEEVYSETSISLDGSSTILSACLRLETPYVSVPWANANTNVRAQQLCNCLAANINDRSQEARY